jgi:hypothetical protein
VLHTCLLLLLVPNTEVLVRFELLYLRGGASGGELSQALIVPANTSQIVKIKKSSANHYL